MTTINDMTAVDIAMMSFYRHRLFEEASCTLQHLAAFRIDAWTQARQKARRANVTKTQI